MKLISCYIENFGKLTNFSYDFDANLNVFCHENGWGKSTFAAFIRAMFYGLEGSGKRSITENERKKYKPWQGGVFGGKLQFEINGKEYVVTRSFADKESSDEFELREASTNLISNDYSERLGEEIFNIDRKSFIRTAFIGQGECESEATDDINAKVSNLTDDTNDINNYEVAINKITGLLNSLTPSRKTGSIAKRKDEITEYEKRISDKRDLKDTLLEYEKLYRNEEDRFKDLKNKLDDTNEKHKQISKLQKTLAKKEERERLNKTLEERRKKLDLAKNVFPSDAPAKKEIEKAQMDIQELDAINAKLLNKSLTENESERLLLLEEAFDNESNPMAHYLTKWNLRCNKKSAIAATEASIEALKASQNINISKKRTSLFLFFIAMIFIALGAVLFTKSLIPFAIVALALGVIILGSSMIVMAPKRDKDETIKVKIEALEDTLNKDSLYIKEVDDEIKRLFYKHERAFDENEVPIVLQELMADELEYKSLLKKKEETNEDLSGRALLLERILKEFFEKYGYSDSENYIESLTKIRSDADVYYEASKLYEVALFEVNEFNKNNDYYDEAITNDEKLPTLEELSDNIRVYTDEINATHEMMINYEKKLDEIKEQLDEYDEDVEKLSELKLSQEEENEKYRLLTLTQQKLELAKIRMTSKYSDPILRSFEKYYSMITGDEENHFYVDANINVTVDEKGKQREKNTLSLGLQDLYGICLRLALIDAMYEDEVPYIVMDDSFVNLDDKKLELAMELLKKVSMKYQIIYFTCSSSRFCDVRHS